MAELHEDWGPELPGAQRAVEELLAVLPSRLRGRLEEGALKGDPRMFNSLAALGRPLLTLTSMERTELKHAIFRQLAKGG